MLDATSPHPENARHVAASNMTKVAILVIVLFDILHVY
jgi:hypothetical protein